MIIGGSNRANLKSTGYSIVHEIVHLDWKLLVREIFMCFEVILIVHVSSHSIYLKNFEVTLIVRCSNQPTSRNHDFSTIFSTIAVKRNIIFAQHLLISLILVLKIDFRAVNATQIVSDKKIDVHVRTPHLNKITRCRIKTLKPVIHLSLCLNFECKN